MTSFIQLEETTQRDRFLLPLTQDLCVGPPDNRFMFGGVGLAAGVAAMERVCARPVVWATAQYLTFARLDQIVELSVEVLNAGRLTSQACVVGKADGEVLFRVSGALGSRPARTEHQWSAMPAVPYPDECPAGEHWRGGASGLHARLDVRVARGRYGRERSGAPEPDGRLLLWVRPKERVDVDAPMLAVIGDLLPAGVGNALGLNAGGNSLDNTLRVLRIQPTAWVLADIAVDGVRAGFAHGAVRLFSEGGELLALASQSLIVRVRETETAR